MLKASLISKLLSFAFCRKGEFICSLWDISGLLFTHTSTQGLVCANALKLSCIIKLLPVPSTPCSSDTVYECPDYQTAGENSCFFNKNHTSIWVNYNITVVATNELGSTFSDSVDVDVVYIGEMAAVCGFFT